MTPAAALAFLVGLWCLVLAVGWARELPVPPDSGWLPEPYLPDVNTAPPGHLMLLPRIGPSRARAIERDRGEKGAFERLDDLQRIRGIGPFTVSALRGFARATPVREGDP